MKYLRPLKKSEVNLFNKYFGVPSKTDIIKSGVYNHEGDLIALVNKGPFGVFEYKINK